MDVAMSARELLAYSNEERDKWRIWFRDHPHALGAAMQGEGRYPTVGSLVDHIFLVERRHLQRLMSQSPVNDHTGVASGDARAIFDYGASVRRDFAAFLEGSPPEPLDVPRTFTVQTGSFSMTPRKLIIHIFLHEIRHWAQVALAVRRAGLAPPGNHDLFYSRAMA